MDALDGTVVTVTFKGNRNPRDAMFAENEEQPAKRVHVSAVFGDVHGCRRFPLYGGIEAKRFVEPGWAGNLFRGQSIERGSPPWPSCARPPPGGGRACRSSARCSIPPRCTGENNPPHH